MEKRQIEEIISDVGVAMRYPDSEERTERLDSLYDELSNDFDNFLDFIKIEENKMSVQNG